MSRMEGFLMKKGWFNNWKMRYVTCSEHVLAIYKTKGEEKNGRTFNVMECTIKRIDAKRWNRKFVFRLKIEGKRIYLAAEDENSLQKWMTAIKGRVARASLLGANAVRCAQGDKRRGSTMASLSRGDCGQFLAFQPNAFLEGFRAAITNSTDPEAQFKFAEICGEFLAIAHSQSQGLFQSNEVKPIPGLNVKFVAPSERRAYLKRMKSTASLFAKRDGSIMLPLQCLIDFGGRTLFFEVKVEGTAKELSSDNKAKLQSLGLNVSKSEAFQDSLGRLWVTNASLSASPKVDDSAAAAFIKALDAMEMFVFDSQSLSEMMRSHGIPVSMLPNLAEMSMIPGIRVLLQIEMIARVCKRLISDELIKLESTEWTTQIVRYFDLILGNNDESNEFWESTLEPAIREKFGVELSKDLPLLHLPQLFFSLQFHTGADFKDIPDYDFTEEHPVLLEHLSSINSVPHHFLVEICSSLRDIADDPYKQLTNGFFSRASVAFNNKVSMFQSIYGDENIFVASGLSQLSQAYLGIGDIEKADLCARGAIGAGRHFHAALVPAYLTLISTCKKEEIDVYMRDALQIVNFQLSDSHWFAADVLMASAAAHQASGDFQEAAKYAQSASEIVHPLLGPGHQKTARCSLLQGRIQRMMGQYAVAQPLIQQALYAMISAFTENSVQAAECQYELADVLLDSGKAEDAEAISLKALRTRQENFEQDSPLVIASVQQLALIYDTMGQADKAFVQYKILVNFLKSLEDESIFEEMVKVMRNILCLFFRSLSTAQRRIVNQLKRIAVTQDAMKTMFQRLIDSDPIDQTKIHLSKYEETGEPSEFDALACIYHIALDDLSTLTWLEEH